MAILTIDSVWPGSGGTLLLSVDLALLIREIREFNEAQSPGMQTVGQRSDATDNYVPQAAPQIQLLYISEQQQSRCHQQRKRAPQSF